MIKLLALISLMLMSLSSMASSSETFNFNGSETVKELLLRADVYRTEYRTEQRPTTCYRQELAGYRPECHYETRQNCYWVPRTCRTVTTQSCTSAPPVCRPVCHQGPHGQICKQVCSSGGTTCRPVYTQQCTGGYNQCTPYQFQVCRDVPYYRTVGYACVETVQVPYQVFDHNTEAKVVLNFAELPQGVSANEKFTVAIQNDDVILSVASSKNVLIYTNKAQNISVSGTVKNINTKIDLKFLDLIDLREAMTNISQVAIKGDLLTFAIGKASNLQFKHKLSIVQKKLFKDKNLIDRQLFAHEVVAYSAGGQQFFSVDLKKLGLDLKDKKHIVAISTEAIVDNSSKPLNHQDLPTLKLSTEVKLKL